MTTTIDAPPGSVTVVIFGPDGTRSDTVDLTPYAPTLLRLAESAPPAPRDGVDFAEISITDEVSFAKNGAPLDLDSGLELLGSGLIATLLQGLFNYTTPTTDAAPAESA